MGKAKIESMPSISSFAKELAEKISRRMIFILLTAFSVLFTAIFYALYAVRTKNIFEIVNGYLKQLLSSNDIFEVTRSLHTLLTDNLLEGFWLYRLPSHQLVTNGVQDGGQLLLEQAIQFNNGSIVLLSHHHIALESGPQFELVFAHAFSPVLPIVLILNFLLIIFYLNRYTKRQAKVFSDDLCVPVAAIGARINQTTLASNEVNLANDALRFKELFDFQEKISELHTRLVESNKELQLRERDTAISRMTASIAHDARMPLSVFANVLESKSWAEFVSHKKQLTSALGRLQTMVDALRRGDSELLLKPDVCLLDFPDLIGQANQYVNRPDAQVDLRIDYIGYLYVDKANLERAITNLVVNALEACRQNVALVVRNENGNLVIQVIDDGKGVAAEFVNQLFVHGQSNDKAGGTGHGLSYVKKVAAGHGGEACYLRQDGRTIFEIRIPQACYSVEKLESKKIAQEAACKEAIEFDTLVAFENVILGGKVLSRLPDTLNIKLVSLDVLFSKEFSARLIVTDCLRVSSLAQERGIPLYYSDQFHNIEMEMTKVTRRIKLLKYGAVHA